jgi:hypothetical protein
VRSNGRTADSEWSGQWHHHFRVVWTDGRSLPKTDDLEPKWNGYSVGHWDGDTFVVESIGFDLRIWLDHNGYPHTENMRLEERYRRVDANTLELQMTITDPVTKPFKSDVKRFLMDRTGVKMGTRRSSVSHRKSSNSTA